jgi:hypothetical protein
MSLDTAELDRLADTIRKTLLATPAVGPHGRGRSDAGTALSELGWSQMLAEMPDVAIPLVFRLLGETGAHAPLINDVVLAAAGRPPDGTVALPYAGNTWVLWERSGPDAETGGPARTPDSILADDLTLHRVPAGEPVPLAAGRRALGWWLTGISRAMLELARRHALDRVQFGRPLASFQAVRHRLAETLVAIEGAEATLVAARDDLGSLLAKAAAGQAAMTSARHCQQVLAGIGFTAEHAFNGHLRRALVLDGLLGSSKELTREVGALIQASKSAPRLVHL